MPYANAAAISRPELNEVLMQAQGVEDLLIASKVLGIHNSPTKHGRYPVVKIEKGALLEAPSLDAIRRGQTGTYNEVERKWEWDTFDTEEFGLEERIDDAVSAEMSKFFDAEVLASKNLRRALMLGHERKVADLVMSSVNSGFTATNSAVAYTEANLATIDFPKDITDAIARLEAVGVVPDTLVMSRAVFNRLRRSTFLQKFIFGPVTNNGNVKITEDIVAATFGLKRLLIGAAQYNSAGKGLAATMSPIWGNTTILLAKTGSGSFDNDIGRSIVWTGDANSLYVTETYRDEARRSDKVRVRMHYSNKITDVTAAQLITTQYA
jgi:hypothetical protein